MDALTPDLLANWGLKAGRGLPPTRGVVLTVWPDLSYLVVLYPPSA